MTHRSSFQCRNTSLPSTQISFIYKSIILKNTDKIRYICLCVFNFVAIMLLSFQAQICLIKKVTTRCSYFRLHAGGCEQMLLRYFTYRFLFIIFKFILFFNIKPNRKYTLKEKKNIHQCLICVLKILFSCQNSLSTYCLMKQHECI